MDMEPRQSTYAVSFYVGTPLEASQISFTLVACATTDGSASCN